ncbi:hypothetical protein OS493_036472 [Desmophyllum pertusum]|uniref:Uncharacterized protein n=1 Tax=Desmophyllum pertusum TaxID=174260 RepID=A0A9W9Y7B4_9CNID|nr:hypothetical protein OS493_036472 [Desmophyllum pertusum]
MEAKKIIIALAALTFIETIEASVVKRETTLSDVEAIYSRYKNRMRGDGTYYGPYPVGRGACTLDPLSPMATKRDGFVLLPRMQTTRSHLVVECALRLQA